MENEFDKYIKMQQDSANRHRGDILEHDGYPPSNKDYKFFAATYNENPLCSGFKIIVLDFKDLFRYKLIRDLGSMMPLVRLKE